MSANGASAWPACLPIVLAFEGGYINDLNDPGGATNMGITIATLQAWRRRPTSIDDVAALTRAEAAEIYKSEYWAKISGDDLPAPIALTTFDAAVNCGVSWAGHWLQAAVGAAQDGNIGPATLAAVRATVAAQGAVRVAAEVCAQRNVHMTALTQWRRFGNGWSRRLFNLMSQAAAL